MIEPGRTLGGTFFENEKMDRSHPIDAFLPSYPLSKHSRRNMRRRFDALPTPPASVEAWVEEQALASIASREKNIAWRKGAWKQGARQKARRLAEAAHREKARQKALEWKRKTLLPRLASWQVDFVAARGSIPWHDLHPADADLVARARRTISRIQAQRRSRRRYVDELKLFHQRAVEEVTRRFNRRVGALRRRKKIDSYGRFLLHLHDAQRASDQAKSRAANGPHFERYPHIDNFDWASANYRRNRDARWRNYLEKSWQLRHAVKLARELGIPSGYQETDDFVPYVIYFELPTGQVSFHADDDGGADPYDGQWDSEQASAARIRKTLRQYLDQNKPSDGFCSLGKGRSSKLRE